jgi:hypothetical protein
VGEEFPIYKIVPYKCESRGNLKMIGLEYPVDFKEVGKLLVVHIRENMSSVDMAALTGQLRSVFGEETVLFALKEDVNFFVAEPMTDEEALVWKNTLKEELKSLEKFSEASSQ